MGGFNLGWLGFAPKSWNKKASEFMSGTEGKYSQKSLLGPEQQNLYNQLLASSAGRGAGGAFGESADYYRDVLSNDPETFKAFVEPEMRRFNQEIIPGLSEQFAGMGSGGLSSSGFRNAAVNAGTDLSERLGAIRAKLRSEAARGLTDIGSRGLERFNENIYEPGTPGLIDQAAPAIGTGVGAFFGGPTGAAIGNQIGQSFSNKGKTSPYGNQAVNSSNAAFFGGYR